MGNLLCTVKNQRKKYCSYLLHLIFIILVVWKQRHMYVLYLLLQTMNLCLKIKPDLVYLINFIQCALSNTFRKIQIVNLLLNVKDSKNTFQENKAYLKHVHSFCQKHMNMKQMDWFLHQ